MVRVNIKKNQFGKGHEPKWSSTRYKVVAIKGNQYLNPGMNKDKLYLRHELLKVQFYCLLILVLCLFFVIFILVIFILVIFIIVMFMFTFM